MAGASALPYAPVMTPGTPGAVASPYQPAPTGPDMVDVAATIQTTRTGQWDPDSAALSAPSSNRWIWVSLLLLVLGAVAGTVLAYAW